MIALSNAINATLLRESQLSISSATSRRSRAICRNALVMEVHPSVPVKTVPDLIAYAKANPGKINMASPGSGTGAPYGGRAVQDDGRRRMMHVPYRGSGPMLNDLLSGQVQFAFDALASSIGHIRGEKLRALGVT